MGIQEENSPGIDPLRYFCLDHWLLLMGMGQHRFPQFEAAPNLAQFFLLVVMDVPPSMARTWPEVYSWLLMGK